MNYLGHIYFSSSNEMAIANLFGDEVKGSTFQHFPPLIQDGISLHRKLDDFMDNHQVVKFVCGIIREELPKVAPIAMDIYFDHLLAKNWGEFHVKPYQQFLADFYKQIRLTKHLFPADFRVFLENMIHFNWMSHYGEPYGLYKMCQGVSSKLSFQNALINGHIVFEKYENIIKSAFYEYMHDANEHFLTNS
jgi:acyl carrier protein phosphodiesterase